MPTNLETEIEFTMGLFAGMLSFVGTLPNHIIVAFLLVLKARVTELEGLRATHISGTPPRLAPPAERRLSDMRLDEYTPSQCREQFRFRKGDIDPLAIALAIPEVIFTAQEPRRSSYCCGECRIRAPGLTGSGCLAVRFPRSAR